MIAMEGMALDKTPGIDEFPVKFFTKHWTTIKEDVLCVVRIFFTTVKLLKEVPWNSIALQHNIHPRHKFLLWLEAWRRWATIERLQKFGIQVSPDYAFCAAPIETFDHSYFECPVTKALWSRLLLWMGLSRTIGSWQQELE
ncbi:hypothetical protein RDI58_010910 [Solanum bulbocastanum]|uniref:Reverse transcriptase zinc-binding domain-containing protein n=1 Tax=Solanum bulbocastanum TaxID=147425 RepID=A0AAN8YFT3_SOLBU